MSAITDEQWGAFIITARLVQPLDTPVAAVHGIVGRSLTKLVDVLCKFWAKHQAKLIPYLAQASIAALNALLAQQAQIDLINPPGPE